MRQNRLAHCAVAVGLLILLAARASAQSRTDSPKILIHTSMGDFVVELWPEAAPKTVANFLAFAEGKGEFSGIVGPKKPAKPSKPYYDGLIFHRVIKDFMIQGGCPQGNGTGGPGFRFVDEINGKALGLDQKKVLTNGQPHPWLGVRTQADWQRNVLRHAVKSLGIDPSDAKERKKRQDEIQKKLDTLDLLELYQLQGYRYNDKLEAKALKKGVLAMANSGANTNGSQFFLNLIDTPWLTGKHTVFGHVVQGMDVLEKIGKVRVGAGSKPLKDVKILTIRRVD